MGVRGRLAPAALAPAAELSGPCRAVLRSVCGGRGGAPAPAGAGRAAQVGAATAARCGRTISSSSALWVLVPLWPAKALGGFSQCAEGSEHERSPNMASGAPNVASHRCTECKEASRGAWSVPGPPFTQGRGERAVGGWGGRAGRLARAHSHLCHASQEDAPGEFQTLLAAGCSYWSSPCAP